MEKEENKKQFYFTYNCDRVESDEYLVVYKLYTDINRLLAIPYLTDKLYGIVQINHQIYITGGREMKHEKKYLKTAVVITINPNLEDIVKPLTDMTIAKATHTLAGVNDEIYSIGGINDTGDLSSCEKYLVYENRWVSSPSLNQKRGDISVIFFSSKYLYAFGGFVYSNKEYSTTIEFLDTSYENEELWKLIKLISGNDIWIGLCHSGIISLNLHEIMIFGGITCENETNQCFIFDINSNSIKKNVDLIKKDTFKKTRLVHIQNEILCIGKNNIHIYDTQNTKWELMKSNVDDPRAGLIIKADTI